MATFEQTYPLLTKPEIVGYMSVDGAREYHADLSQLKFITRIPTKERISFNLDHNSSNAVKRTSEDNVEKIDLLLKFVLDQTNRIRALQPNPHFILYRRTLISIFCSSLGLERSCVVASLFNGVIYLCTIVGPRNDKKNMTEENLRFCAWGYKFEQYMNADLPGLQPDIQKPVVENAEFSMYFHARLRNHSLLYGAQIDGMLATHGEVGNPPQNASYDTNLHYLRQNSYAELKTNKEICHRKQEENLKKYKMFKCWAQCYLAGLKGLIIGFRNDRGIVQRLQWFDTDKIVDYCQDIWNPAIPLQFLDYFLSFVKNTFKSHINSKYGDSCDFENIDPITFKFDIGTDRRIEITHNVSIEILPQWFVNAQKKMK